MTKQEALKQLTAKLRQQLSFMMEAAKNTHKAATGEESKQEGKYDTRGLEASYLAGAQAQQTKKLTESLHIFESWIIEGSSDNQHVIPGSLVEIEHKETISYYLLTPSAGGMSIDYEMGTLTTLSPEAPLYQNLLGKGIGDLIEDADIIILDIS